MANLRRLWCILAGERDQTDIAVTREAAGARFRLPGRGHDREFWTPWLVGSLALTPIFIFIIIQAGLELPPEDHNVVGTTFCLAAILAALGLVIWKWRITWHYQVTLTPTQLIVDYFATNQQHRLLTLDVTKIRQLTLIRYSDLTELQAECDDDSLWRLVRDREFACVMRLAQLITAERPAPIPIHTESPGEIQAEREEPPLNSKIVLTRTETGVTLDFPMPEDRRASLRRKAWRWFEAGLFLLVGDVLAYAILAVFQWRDPLPFLAIPFFAGLICLMTAASQASTAWSGAGGDADLRQLGVAGNLLIRTTRDHNKRVWFDHEIARIEVERDFTEDGPDWLLLKLHTNAGEATTLYGPFGDDSRTDYRRKAMLEWIATVLKHALHRSEHDVSLEPMPAEVEESRAHAIQDKTARSAETHITH